MEQHEAMEQQRDILFSNLVSPDIDRPCVVGDGIVLIDAAEQQEFIRVFKESNCTFSLFIPASGVGSRMFEFIYRFQQSSNEVDKEDFLRFIANLSKFAFYSSIASHWKHVDLASSAHSLAFCEYLLLPDGMNFRDIPKALFPFHQEGSIATTPIDAHIRQALQFSKVPSEVHFTIQNNHLETIKAKLKERVHDVPFSLQCSVQSQASDAFIFDEFKQPVLDAQGIPLRKPSGHGALIENLSTQSSDVIFIKNIDNIQCSVMDHEINQYWELLGGLLIHIVDSVQKAIHEKNASELLSLNHRFGLSSELNPQMDWDTMVSVFNRPYRVCGMVRNEGMPGGGPFWVKDQKGISKQIIEKSQISQGNMSCLTESTHFNSVMMALYKKDIQGNSQSLSSFVRTDLSMAVCKRHQGKLVYHIEKPGLWNGSMYAWNTVFIEIPSHVFSPVKSVLDLMDPIHQCSSTQMGGRMKEN